jgi:hypothetical protein
MVLSYGCCRVALFVTALAKRGSYRDAAMETYLELLHDAVEDGRHEF